MWADAAFLRKKQASLGLTFPLGLLQTADMCLQQLSAFQIFSLLTFVILIKRCHGVGISHPRAKHLSACRGRVCLGMRFVAA